MKKHTLYTLAILSLFASCSEEEIVKVTPTSGEEVKFSASMDKTASRTLYGDIAEDGKSIKVNWVDGDEITVFGTTCAVQQANYKVSTKDASGVAATDQNYASSLEKTGAAGVQWGTEDNSDFYAIYPAVEGAFYKEGDDVLVDTKIDTIQHASFTYDETNNVWVATPYGDNLNNASMNDALMYAYTNVNYSDNKGVVDLNFKPFSTVLKFKLAGWTKYNEDGDLGSEVESEAKVNITKITLIAPADAGYNISGDCTFRFVKGSDDNGNTTMTVNTEEGDGYNYITIQPYLLSIGQKEAVEFSVFAIPQEYTINSTASWKVKVETSNYGTYTFKITPTVAQTMVQGQIHNVNVGLFELHEEFDLTEDPYLSEWMKYIPRNVYLSEISAPGAWYATNSSYQTTDDLEAQYAEGIRAFNIDCRMTASADSWTKSWGVYSINDNPTYLLQCAGSETLTGTNVVGVTTVYSVGDGKTVESQLKILGDLVANNPEEFVYVVLTIAERPKGLQGALSSDFKSFGNNVDPDKVLSAIKEILDRRGEEFNVFGFRDEDKNSDGTAKKINANTTLNDVLGSMIIKINVNVDQESTSLSNYNMSNVLLSEGSMASEETFITGSIVKGVFNTMNVDSLYWGASFTDPLMKYYYHQAQETTSSTTATSSSDIPSLYDRHQAIDDIFANSYSIYSNSEHNGLFQMGIGGYINSDGEDRTTVASNLNSYVLNLINEKMGITEGSTAEPSPVGIVLMNFCTGDTYSGESLTKAIIKMNTMFYLNRDKSQVEWPNGNPFDDTEEDPL